jgi:hypothetical protein
MSIRLGKIKQEPEDDELSDGELEVYDYDSFQLEEKPEIAESPSSKKKRVVFTRVQKKTLLVRFKWCLFEPSFFRRSSKFLRTQAAR